METPAFLLVTALLSSQGDGGEATPLSGDEKAFRLSVWREKPAARIRGRDVPIGEILDYLESRYAPRLNQELDSAYGKIQLESGDFDLWVESYVDLQLLRPVAAQKSVTVNQEEVAAEAKRLAEEEKTRYVSQGKLDAAAAEAALPSLVARTLRNRGLAIEKRLLLDKILPSSFDAAELRAHFTANALRYGGTVKLSQILLSTRDPITGKLYPHDTRELLRQSALDLAKKLREGTDFAEAARVHSDDLASRPKGGDLGYVRRQGPLPEAVTRAAFAATPGDILGPIETELGFHILKVAERKATRHPEFADVRKEVEEDYRREKAARLLEHLRKEADRLLY